MARPPQQTTAERQPASLPAQGRLGTVLLSLSAAGVPLIWLLLRRAGRRGSLAVSAGCGALLIRDLSMVADGAPARLRPLPRILLLLEAAISTAATIAGLWVAVPNPLLGTPAEPDGVEGIASGSIAQESDRCTAMPHNRRAARTAECAALATFVLHTARFAIYLRADHGLRRQAADPTEPQ